MKNILISNPSIDTKGSWLPLLWGLLKTYAEVDYEHKETITNHYNWLKPIYHRASVSKILDMYPDTPIDVLGLSCYMWNWELNLELARVVKQRNPNCLIVAGGPQLSWQDVDDYGVIDIIVMKEGERAFADILYHYATSDDPMWESACTNVIVPTKEIRTAIGKLPIEELTSPWLHHRTEYENFTNDIIKWKRRVDTFWETNRGCPYQCTFCDWGSDTYAAVRKYDHQRILAEAEFFGTISVYFVFITDANFGMIPRDLEYAQALADSKKKTGHPVAAFFNTAKNKKVYVNAINRVLFDASMIYANQIAFQHTKLPVLSAIKRDNIPIEKMFSEMRDSWEVGIPVLPVLISANPGDTVELWKQCIDDTLTWGFHEDIRINDFALLANAPAAQRDYMDEWEIDVVNRRFPDYPPSKAKTENENKTDFIVSTKTFSRDDWVEMKCWSEMIQGLHHCPMLRFIAIYLHHYEGIPYRTFYQHMIDVHPILSKVRMEIEAHLYRYLEDEDEELFMNADDTMRVLVQPSDFAYIRLLNELDALYADLVDFIQREFSVDHAVLSDLVEFNKQMIITPDYNPVTGKQVELHHNWRELFSRIINACPQDVSLVPLRKLDDTFTIHQDTSGMYGCRSLDRHSNMGEFFINVIGIANQRHYTMYFRDVIDDWKKSVHIPIFSIAQ